MPGTVQDMLVHTQDGFENLPADGNFEVVDGRAILPPTDVEHDYLSDDPVDAFRVALKAVGYGFVVSTPNVFIPALPGHRANSKAGYPTWVFPNTVLAPLRVENSTRSCYRDPGHSTRKRRCDRYAQNLAIGGLRYGCTPY